MTEIVYEVVPAYTEADLEGSYSQTREGICFPFDALAVGKGYRVPYTKHHYNFLRSRVVWASRAFNRRFRCRWESDFISVWCAHSLDKEDTEA